MENGPAARRRPTAAREAYSLYVERAAAGGNEADGPFSAARRLALEAGDDAVAVIVERQAGGEDERDEGDGVQVLLLADVGAKDGDVLRLQPEITAG